MRNTRVLLTREDWVEAAIDELSVTGFGGVAIEPLARRLKISKGSFYWHFKDRSALVRAVLDTWKVRAFTEVTEQLDAIADPRRRLAALIQTAWRDPRGLRAEGALVSAAVSGNPQVKPVVRNVMAGRLAYVRAIYAGMGLAPGEADRWAVTAYSAYTGLVQMTALRVGPVASDQEIQELAAHCERVLIPARRRSGKAR